MQIKACCCCCCCWVQFVNMILLFCPSATRPNELWSAHPSPCLPCANQIPMLSRPTVGRSVDRRLTDDRSIHRPHIGRHTADTRPTLGRQSTDMSTDSRLRCRPLHRWTPPIRHKIRSMFQHRISSHISKIKHCTIQDLWVCNQYRKSTVLINCVCFTIDASITERD